MAVKKRAVLVANKSYGLYIGETIATNEEIQETRGEDGTMSLAVTDVRHVARWFGKTGGITSLAMFGPCGSRAKESRVGAASPSALLGGIVNVFDLSKEAVAAFAAIEPSGT
jgi:hypothetical protein